MPRGHVLPNSELLAALRGEAGLTQDELAARAGYGLRTIGKIERGQPTTSFTLSAIATVLGDCLGRRIATIDLLHQADGRLHRSHVVGSTFIVGEHVQLLELPSPRRSAINGESTGDRSSRAVLIDTLCLRYVPTDRTDIQLHYATTGTALAGRSLSHPDQAEWIVPAVEHQNGVKRDRLNVRGALQICVPAESGPRPTIQNQVEFVDAHAAPDQQWFQTEIVYPTDSVTLIVRFPRERPYASLRGRCGRRTASPLLPAAEQPIPISPGRLAYWRIATPTPGETYRLDWT